MKILALDLGKFNTAICFYDTVTRNATFMTSPMQREHFNEVFTNSLVFTDRQIDLVVMEACQQNQRDGTPGKDPPDTSTDKG